MHFLAPFFAVLTTLAAVPVVIHLWGRSRARVRPFPAMDFLLAGHRRVARRTRLRQILLLLLRAAIMAAVPLCLAKPFIETLSDLPAQVSGAQSAVLVLDDSLAMNYRLDGTPLLTRARARAGRLVDALGSNAEAALVLGSRGAGAPVPELTGDRARLSRAIAAVGPSYRPVDLGAAVRRAAQILSGGRGRRRIYLLSTLSVHALDPAVVPPPDIEVVPIDVADGKALPNRAVVDLHVDPAPGLGPSGVRVSAEVVNHAAAPVKDLPITLFVDGKAVASGLVDLPAHGRAVKRFFHVLGPPPQGQQKAEAREPARSSGEAPAGIHDVAMGLKEDALAADDRRHLRVEVQRPLRVFVIDGDPRNLRRDDEVFYLETALHPGDRDDSPIHSTTAAIEDAAGRPLDEYDAVFLCNAKAQDLQRAHLDRALRDFVTRGGGLLIAMGDNVDPDAYNSALGDLLPQALAGTKTPGADLLRRPEQEGELREREAAPGGAGERVGRLDRRHPLLLPISGGHAAESLYEARFGRYMLLRPTPKTLGAGAAVRALISYETGAPALIEKGLGEGRVLLLTTTVDRDWTDLPIQPVFLPLMQQAVRYLSRAPMREPEPPGFIGQRHEIRLREDDARVEVTLPSGQKRLFERERLSGRRLLGFTDTEEPGIYRVAAASEDRVLRPRPTESFVVNVDPAESDLGRASAERIAALSRALPGDEGPAGGGPRRRVELWHFISAALLLLLIGEALLLHEK